MLGVDGLEEYVGALDVPVHDLILVQLLDRLEKRLGVIAHNVLGQTRRLARQSIQRTLVATKLHENENLLLPFFVLFV